MFCFTCVDDATLYITIFRLPSHPTLYLLLLRLILILLLLLLLLIIIIIRYQDELHDLLNPSKNATKLTMRHDEDKGISVDGALKVPAASVADVTDAIAEVECQWNASVPLLQSRISLLLPVPVFNLICQGLKRRVVGSTAANERSSRSHAVLTLHLSSVAADENSSMSSSYTKRSSKFHLVDLAGSERQSVTSATGDRLKEGAMINVSLSALGNVINALSSAAKPGDFGIITLSASVRI